MSKSINSPTARLLQSSRLFSLPRPLPQPALELATSTGSFRASDTATIPYPTYQALTTPASSHFRGDWGLKRPLPARSTKNASTVFIRVKAQDNAQHITDFESSADHTMTEAKWREMGIPMITKETRTMMSGKGLPPKSVYDDDVDNTIAVENAPVVQSSSLGSEPRRQRHRKEDLLPPNANQQWKREGPWIGGMQEGEFHEFLENQIASRKSEFREFLLERFLENRVNEERRKARESGKAFQEKRRDELGQELRANFTEEEKRLRDKHSEQQLSSEMTAAICDFLDLPSVRATDSAGFGRPALNPELNRAIEKISTHEITGPPSTHPGAGLSHLRTNLIMENHPVLGPQAHRSPVLARVLRPRNSAQGTEHNAKIGVGGIVTSDPIGASFHPARNLRPSSNQDSNQDYRDSERMVQAIHLELEGGNKMWVQPETAYVDERGRIRLEVSRADKEAIAVKEDDLEEIHESRRADLRLSSSLAGQIGSTLSRSANYGYSLPDMRYATPNKPPPPPPPRSTVRGFDQELGRTPEQGEMDEGRAAARIKDLLAGRGNLRTKLPPR